MINIKRAYEPASASDGRRVLIDRLWPRGVSKQRARVDRWAKEVAPSAELRKWFGHDPAKWAEFRKRYRAELQRHAADLEPLEQAARSGPLTLVYGARDEEHNDAVVLKEVLEERTQKRAKRPSRA